MQHPSLLSHTAPSNDKCLRWQQPKDKTPGLKLKVHKQPTSNTLGVEKLAATWWKILQLYRLKRQIILSKDFYHNYLRWLKLCCVSCFFNEDKVQKDTELISTALKSAACQCVERISGYEVRSLEIIWRDCSLIKSKLCPN